MSDRMMPLDEALEWVAQDKSTRSTARAARKNKTTRRAA